VDAYLSPEQRFIVAVYNKILESDKKVDFVLENDFTKDQLDEAITNAMIRARQNSSIQEQLEVKITDQLVIHGVHQFSPLLLRAIEEMAKYKKVILLINYQKHSCYCSDNC
jgi:hypothetical protein